jgi:hypothetical protein
MAGNDERQDEDAMSPEELSASRRVGKSEAKAGDADLRDAATFRALREQEKTPPGGAGA